MNGDLARAIGTFGGLRVLVTGHTGFKGAWLCHWLVQQGAIVSGFALPPEPDSLFDHLRLRERLDHTEGNICDATAVAAEVRRRQPDVIFHLAAQAIVRRGYREPLLTWQTNLNGTLNVLEAAREVRHSVSIVAVTTDKVYRNREDGSAYREEDELGGHDPYSASKAACELAVASWRASFGSSTSVQIATARAGNVIGGLDLSADRLVPDCFRAWRDGRDVRLRHPGATRPWQHVLEPLAGYLMLAAHLRSDPQAVQTCNFGPSPSGTQSVRAVVSGLASLGVNRRWSIEPAPPEHEAQELSLCIDRARARLGWAPRLSFDEMLAWTDQAYSVDPGQLPSLIDRQIAAYIAHPTPL